MNARKMAAKCGYTDCTTKTVLHPPMKGANNATAGAQKMKKMKITDEKFSYCSAVNHEP